MKVSYRYRVCYFVNVIAVITFVNESRSPDRLQHSMPPVGAEAGGGLLYMFECVSHGPTLYSPGAMRQPAFLAPWHAGPLTPLLRRNLFDFWWAFATAAILVTLRCPLRLARWVRSGLGSNGPWRFGVCK